MMDYDILKSAVVDIGRDSFYEYCRLRLPVVYKKDRAHLKILCNELQAFIEDEKLNNLCICLPPRFGKSTSVQLLTEWFLGGNPKKSIITASYNELLSSRFSRSVRNGISEKSIAGSNKFVFADFFPGVRIKDGDSSVQMWSLEDSFFSYLATSPGGTVTGVGATGLMIIDDLVKNAEEAFNERVLNEHWEWYCNTMLSRCEAGCKKIVIMTRWSTKDMVGRFMQHERDQWKFIVMPAQNPDGSMLCDSILSREEFEDRKKKTDPVIIAGNYQQEPYDDVDKLYKGFQEYTLDQIPDKWERVESYTDTADAGGDALVSITYGVSKGKAYVLDLIYSQEGMEQTEAQVARMLDACHTTRAWIESNNGGRGFARNVEKRLRETGNTTTSIGWFHQSANKEARILTHAFSVQNCVLFPPAWRDRYPGFAKELEGMGRNEKWAHDDAADALTGIIEKSLTKNVFLL